MNHSGDVVVVVDFFFYFPSTEFQQTKNHKDVSIGIERIENQQIE
jgi:hypothetical protein